MTDGSRPFIHYVGETTDFLKRQQEHLTEVRGLNYGVFAADAVAANDLALIHGGMWRDTSADPITRTVAKWLANLRQPARSESWPKQARYRLDAQQR